MFGKYKISSNVFILPRVLARRKTGKFSLSLVNKSVSTEIIMQKLTTTGTGRPMQGLCRHGDLDRLCSIDILSFLLEELVQMMEAVVRMTEQRKIQLLTLFYAL